MTPAFATDNLSVAYFSFKELSDIGTMSIFETVFLRAFYVALWLKQRSTLGAQIALIDNRKVLLVRHSYKSGWHLPGGGVEPPEPPERTAQRELKEETGYELFDAPDLLGVFPNPSAATKSDYLVVFASSAFTAPESHSSREIAETRWFALDDLPADATAVCHTVAQTMID